MLLCDAEFQRLAPVRVEQGVAVEIDDPREQRAVRFIRRCLDVAEYRTESRGQLARAQRQTRDDAETAAAAALDGPVQIGVCAGIGDAHLAIGCNDFRFQQSRGRGAEILREVAKPTALDQAGDSNSCAPSALNVTARACRDGGVGIHPHNAGAQGDGRLRPRRPSTTLRNEVIVQGHLVHVPGPNQERIRRIGGALVTVPAAFDDQAQIVLPREVDRCDHVSGVLRRNRIGAGLRSPGIDPAAGLRQRRLVANKVRILQARERFLADRALWHCRARSRRCAACEW